MLLLSFFQLELNLKQFLIKSSTTSGTLFVTTTTLKQNSATLRPQLMYVFSAISFPTFVTTAQEEVVIVGRITHDAETVATSRLNEGAIFIESSRMLSGGARIPLKFDPTIKIRGGVRGSGGFGLFPGKIAAFKGKNGSGGYFLATEYLSVS